ncbi:MAG: hypothetical protein D6702_04790 [Planctomycetota bacterium]|nr:MAG: hypothetical protein D6702_04790 [Planctomycetota bacterium]
MRTAASLLFACAFLLPAAAPAQQRPDWLDRLGRVEEPRTGIPFAEYRRFPGGEEEQLLIGTGLYTKTFLRIKIYAFGFYVEPEGAAASLGRWQGLPARQVARDPEFYRALWAGDFAKSVRWILCRDVDGDDVAEAFDDVLGPRLERLGRRAEPAARAEADRALAEFRSYFETELEKGMELVFAWYPGGRLVTVLGGRVAGTLQSELLCRALFACYLDNDPLDEDAKEGFASCVDRIRLAADTEAARPAPDRGSAVG